MNKKVIPTALPDENIGIASMTVRYAQRPDCNDESQEDQFLTVEAVNYDDGDDREIIYQAAARIEARKFEPRIPFNHEAFE